MSKPFLISYWIDRLFIPACTIRELHIFYRKYSFDICSGDFWSTITKEELLGRKKTR